MNRKLEVVAATASAALLSAVPLTAAAQQHPAPLARASAVHVRKLVADRPGRAKITDPNLVNAWGLSHGPDTPLWVSDNGTNVSTVYSGATKGSPISIVPLVVKIPGGVPTGQTFNPTHAFRVPGTGKPALFIFAGEGGALSAWNQSVTNPNRARKVAQVANGVFKGLALERGRHGPRLLATNFHTGRIDIFNARFNRVGHRGMFRDPSLPRGYAPFNVKVLHGRVYVTYAKQDSAKHDDVAGRGHGFIDVYTKGGAFVQRLVSRGLLNSPWGMVTAPKTFGPLAGSLLVGNFGSGRIHAFNPRTGTLLATLRRPGGRPVHIDGLWALVRGDAVAGGPRTIWFSAGPDDEAHGLLGTIRR